MNESFSYGFDICRDAERRRGLHYLGIRGSRIPGMNLPENDPPQKPPLFSAHNLVSFRKHIIGDFVALVKELNRLP